MLQISLVSVKLNKKDILTKVSFSAQEGELVGIAGKNGAGKTTLFSAIFQDVKFEGEINMAGQRIQRRDIAFVESENSFYPYLTGFEFLSFLSNKSENSNKNLLLEYFDVPKNIYIENLSTGERKKLAIIANVLLNKKLYLFDEPFNGLDIESIELLKSLLKSKIFENKIVLISSHILAPLKEICSQINYLENGHLKHQLIQTDFNEIEKFLIKDIHNKVRNLERTYAYS